MNLLSGFIFFLLILVMPQKIFGEVELKNKTGVIPGLIEGFEKIPTDFSGTEAGNFVNGVKVLGETELSKEFCYRFVFTSRASNSRYSLQLAKGQKVLAVSAQGNEGLVDYCPVETNEKIELRLVSNKIGKGNVDVSGFRKKRDSLSKDEVPSVAVSGLKMGEPDMPPIIGTLMGTKKVSVDIPLPAGSCYFLAFLPGKGIEGFEVETGHGKEREKAKGISGEHKILKYCGKKEEIVKVGLKATSGKGVFVLAIFNEQKVQEVGVGGKTSKEVLLERVRKFLERMSSRMAPVGIEEYFVAPAEEGFKMQIPVKNGVCYRIASAGDPDVKSIELNIKPAKKTPVTGKQIDNFIVADYCSTFSGKLDLSIKAEGTGGIGVIAFAGSPDSTVFSSPSSVFNLERLLSNLESAKIKFAEKMEPADVPYTNILKYGEEDWVEVLLDKDYCYRFIVVTDCKDLCQSSMSVWKGGEKMVDGKFFSGVNTAEFCPGETLKIRVAMKLEKTERGKEAVAFAVMRKKAEGKMKIYAAGDGGKDYISSRIVERADKDCKGMSAVSPVAKKSFSTNETYLFDVKLAGGVCYKILVVGEPSVKDIKASLINPAGQEIAKEEDSGPEAVIVTQKCPEWDGIYKVKVKMFLGYGKVGMQVFADL